MLNLLTLYGMYCFFICMATYRQLRPDVLPAASGRTARCVATQFGGHRAHSYFLRGLAEG